MTKQHYIGVGMTDRVFTRVTGRRRSRCGAVFVLGLLLAGCDEGRFTADLATDAPADPEVTRVDVSLLGLELRKADGINTTLEFNTGELVNLLVLRDGNPLRLFTSERLSTGTYTGVRLLFDESADAIAVSTDGTEFPVLLADGAFAVVDFTVEENQGSQESLTVTLDLRQSLSFDDVNEEYTLTPRLRSVRTTEAAQIEGIVNVTCPVGTTLAQGGAVYLFAGADVTPDDLDGTAAEPYATTRVVIDSVIGRITYALRFLSAGDYTLALTCRGDEDDLDTDDDLEFGNTTNVQIDEGAVVTLNLN
jgi:Domain of unknown function (DUF4382)